MPMALDITLHEKTKIDYENSMVSFAFSIDDLNTYCYKIWDHPQFDCLFTFKIL